MKPKHSLLTAAVSFLLFVLFMPFVVFTRAIKPGSGYPFPKRISELFVAVFVLIPLWAAVYGVAGYLVLFRAGYIPEEIDISGTGSMYPTFPKGEGHDPKALSKQIVSSPGMFRFPDGILVLGKRYFNHIIGDGDIVVAQNKIIDKTTRELYGKESGLVKRVIAVPGDSIEFRDGIVFLNGQPRKEPYIARARSTFGGSFIPDCHTLTIPPHKYFLMGDNRKGSGDSRHDIGLVDESDILYVLPYKKQIGVLDKQWRDPTNDLSDSSKIFLDKIAFMKLLNDRRREVSASPLVYHPKLEASAARRGGVILKYDDFSFDATRSGYTMKKATTDAGYSNIVYGESVIQGYYEADELIENMFESPESKKFLTNKDFDDMGIAEVGGSLNNCPAQVVVLHFAGYVPPNYTKDVVESWANALTNLKNVQASWANLKTYPEYYDRHKSEVDRMNDIITIRILNITGIVDAMEKNYWLSAAQENYIKQDEVYQKEMSVLAQKLNGYRN